MSIKPLDPNSSSSSYQLSLHSESDLFNDFPTEVIQSIFNHLSGTELGKCKLVCKRWRAIASDEVYLKKREPEIAFGQDKWKAHIGRVGKVPRLPNNIDEILESPCPIWEGKKIKETHVLVYIPSMINGEPHTLKKFGKRIPIEGRLTGYRHVWGPIFEKHADISLAQGEWVLMTREVLPESRNKKFSEQERLVKSLSEKAQAEYHIPKLIEAITCIFAEYKRSHTRLYSDDPWTYTRCQEITEGYFTAVGGFSKFGLCVSNSISYDIRDGIGAVRMLRSSTS